MKINKYIWEKNFETGINRIDFEHQVFLELINSFRSAINAKASAERLKGIITELEKYAEFHFISEENFMKCIGYPEFKKHQTEHFELLENFNLSKHQNDFSIFLEFLFQWFANHTVAEDKKLKEYVMENNIHIEDFYYNIMG